MIPASGPPPRQPAKGSVTVIIPAWGEVPTLPAAIDAICRQERQPDEIIVVHSGPGDLRARLAGRHPALRVEHHDRRMFAADARNLGLELAKGQWLVFMDADVMPADDWLAHMMAALEAAPGRFVAGAVGFARPGGYWGLALWAIEFSSVHPYMPARVMAGACTANLGAAAADVNAVNGFPGHVGSSEDVVLAARLRARGLQNWFEPGARVGHMNLAGFTHFAIHLWNLGLWSARVRQREALPGDLVVRFPPLALPLWLYRVVLTCGRAIRWGRGLRGAFALRLPAIVLGSLIWNAGFLRGLTGRRHHH
ncbi:MAG: glycosyltransferase [Hyphomicrobiales bacterium]|nr:glycosyltransferase [Hyphomicrobiales bacterium]